MPQAPPYERLRDEFNRWAEAGRGEAMEQDHLPVVLPVLGRMRLDPDENVLDVGCGAGWLARLLAEHVPEGRVVGLDISDEMIRRARRHCADLESVMFITGEAEEIPWDAAFFTRVISVESAYYWPDPPRALAEIFRVLREGGSVWLLVNYYAENPHTRQWADVLPVPVHLFSIETWSQLLREAGFVDVSHVRIPDPTPVTEPCASRWFRDAAQLRAFREIGALLLRGTKPRL